MIIKRAAKAIITDYQGRYLFQLRDDIPTITFPGYWGLFGGALESMETPILAIKRELYEELSYRPDSIKHFFLYDYSLDMVNIVDREMTVFTCSIKKSEVHKLELKEGRCFSFFTTQELKNRKVVPLDLSVVLMHQLSNLMPHLLKSN